MKTTIKIIIFILLTSGQLRAQSNDYSDSVIELIELINKKIKSRDSLSVNIEFTNRHRAEYKVNSTLTVRKENITLKSHINNTLSEESHSTFSYTKTEFEKELRYQIQILSEYKEQLVLGGNHQEINLTFDNNNVIKTYKTTKAFALMTLFVRGGLKYKTE